MGVEYDGTYIELWSTGVIGNDDCEHGMSGVRENGYRLLNMPHVFFHMYCNTYIVR